MKTLLQVFNSDRVNRYGAKFTIGALESAIEQKWQIGTPMHISHDYHRSIGWTYPLSLLFEPSIAKLLGIAYFPENEEERQLINQNRFVYFQENIKESCEPYKDELLKLIGNKDLDDYQLLDDSCVSFFKKDIAKEVFDEIFKNLDDDNLYPISGLKHLGAGVFEINGLALFSHHYFRRSFSRINNSNTHLFDYFDELKDKSVNIKLAFDPDLVGLAKTFRKPFEYEYWWGPKFNNDLSKIPNGLTKHKADEIQKLYYLISETDFFWYSRKGEKTLEIEELRDYPSFLDQSKYICRYVHSIVKEEDNKIFHLDGAVRIYSEDKMLERVDKSLSEAKRDTDYIKLFRIDGDIKLCEWKRVISDYFRDNTLVGEYFGEIYPIKKINESKIEHTDNYTKPKTIYLPFSLKNEEGFIVNYSYHPISENDNNILWVEPLDYFVIDDKKFKYIEESAWELKKILKRNSIDLFIPEDAETIVYEDFYYNFPLIIFRTNDQKIIDTFITALKIILKNYSDNKSENRQVSFSIEVPLSNHSVRFSFLGSAVSLLDFLNQKGLPIFVQDKILTYLNEISLFLKNYTELSSKNTLDIVKHSGVLMFNRVYVDSQIDLKLHYDKNEKALFYEIKNIQDDELYNRLSEKSIEVTPALLIKKVTCNKCKEDYYKCSCSVFDGDTNKIMSDFKYFDNFYTDKKA